jgi:hypothetical protein
MSSVTVTENNNKVSVDTTTNVVTVTSPGTVGPQGGAGTIESATASATTVAVSSAGVSGTPTAAITLGGTAAARTMAFAFGLPTGNSGVIGSIVTTGTDGIDIDSGATMDSFASTMQLGINAQTLWTHILEANVTGDALIVSDGTNTSPIALEGTITYAAVANETTVAESAGTITIGLVDNPTVSGNLIVSGNLTVSGSTTTINSTVLNVVDPIMVLQSVSGGGVLTSDTNKDVGLVMQYHTGSANKTAFLGFDDSVGKLTFIPDATISSEVASGTAGTIVANIEGAVTGAVTGNASTATALATARDIGGVSFDGTANINLPGVNTSGTQATSGNATTATTATNVTAVANNSTDEDIFLTFVDGATGAQGIETDTGLTYNPSSGLLTSAGFAGPITGAVTGNASTATALATARTIGGTSFDGTANIAITTNANLTGHVTSSGNATTLGVFTVAQLSSALSDASISGNNTGDLTNGIANTNNVVIDHASVADDDYAKFTSSGLEGRSATEAKTDLSLNNVENTALSTWAGTTNITTAGTIGTGTWQGTAVAQSYIADQAINEAKLQVSNAPTNGYVLTAQSGNTGGMTWEVAGVTHEPGGTGIAMAIALG